MPSNQASYVLRVVEEELHKNSRRQKPRPVVYEKTNNRNIDKHPVKQNRKGK